MTYRERRERKAERLREWAAKRDAKAEAAFEAGQGILGRIPPGQPILIGHHSERGHRADLAKVDRAMAKTAEHSAKAGRFHERADNIERAAKRAIYSDDADAPERLRAKVAALEAKRERIKRYNASARKGSPDESILNDSERAELLTCRRLGRPHIGERGEFPGYVLRNLGGNITRTRKRLAEAEAGDRGAGRWLTARYSGACANCGAEVERGDRVRYYRRTREIVCCEGDR